jgi:hypothetical protein
LPFASAPWGTTGEKREHTREEGTTETFSEARGLCPLEQDTLREKKKDKKQKELVSEQEIGKPGVEMYGVRHTKPSRFSLTVSCI